MGQRESLKSKDRYLGGVHSERGYIKLVYQEGSCS